MSSFNYNLEDQVFVVTGGSRGIGLEIARQLLGQKAKVVICGRKQEGLDLAAQELGAGDNLFAVGMNIITTVVDADPGLWQKIIDSNLNGNFLCSRKAGQIMRNQQNGKIVNISSIAARRSAPAMGIYGIAKAGIEMLTKVLAQELAPFNIQVNAVAPCMVRTAFSEPFWSNEDLHEAIVKTIPLGRIAEPIDIAHPALFLCSAGADFITGQTLLVDGGASAI
jgi:2-deoxy-D-gluconate 3-dehydrogenase